MLRFKGKNVAIIGLSVEGIDSVKFFSAQGATISCRDRRTPEELGDTYGLLAAYGVIFELGESYLRDLDLYDVVVRSPGVSPRIPELLALQKKGKQVVSATRLFFDLCPAPIIGVTGTKGKGTTSTLITSILQASGRTVWLGGNVGEPLLSKVDRITPADTVVLELSSFQLEDLQKSPHIAVVLRITQDHLLNFDKHATNFHPTREDYVRAKEPIVRFQKPGDIAIFNADDQTSTSFAKKTKAKAYFFSRHDTKADAYVDNHTVYLRVRGKNHEICDSSSVQLRGDHNLENIAAASLVASLAGVSIQDIQKAVAVFKGLEHRLEFVRTAHGVSYFDDSFSTVPDTTIAAIEAFSEPIVLVVGGSEKGSDFTELGKRIAASTVKTLVVIGDMTQRILDAVKTAGYKGELITGCKTMHEIVQKAYSAASPGDVVILSPACASFDMFQNYKDRGKQFKHEVSAL